MNAGSLVERQASNRCEGPAEWGRVCTSAQMFRQLADTPMGSLYSGVSPRPVLLFTMAPAARRAIPSPLHELLDCDREFIHEAGAEALHWIAKQEEKHRVLYLRRLARILDNHVRAPNPASPNVVAALELLARYDAERAAGIVAAELKTRPVGENHLYLVSICRDVTSRPASLATELGEVIEEVVEAQAGSGLDPSVEWQGRLWVEAFRVLSRIAPERAVGRLCRWIPAFGETEVTAVLEHVARAARERSSALSTELGEAVDQLWARYVHDNGLSNVPGVLAKLLELKGWAGARPSELLEMAATYRSPTQLLYLLLMRKPPLWRGKDKIHVYAHAIRLAENSGHRMALQHLMNVMMQDSELNLRAFLEEYVGIRPSRDADT